jgi:signal transduction histidine kinase
LGLSVSYEIIKAHGGELAIASVHGEYTQVSVSLPVLA